MTGPHDRPGRPAAGRDTLAAAAASLAVIAFYVVRYPLAGIQVSLGSDTPVYVWWARFSGVEGIGSFRTAGRPATVAAMATLSRITGSSAAGLAAALGPALAAALGLALAALVHSAWSRDRLRFTLTVALTGTFLALMVAGYLSTLVFGVLFAASVALLSESVDREGDTEDRSSRPLIASSVLLGAAGLAHLQFMALAGATLLGAVAALLPAWHRDRAAGVPLGRTSLGRLLLAGAGGVAVSGAGLGATLLGGRAGAELDTSRDAFLRRTGLSGPLAQSYRRKLRHDFPWYRGAVLLASAGMGLVPRARTGVRGDRARLLWGVLVAWLVLTLAGLILLVSGIGSPAQRLAAFCLPVPVLAAGGLSWAARSGGRSGPRRSLRLIGAASGVALFVLVAWLSWVGQRPLVTPAALDQARVAGAFLGKQPAGTPLVLVADDRTDKPSLFVTRYANYLRDAVPAARVSDVFVFPGSVADLVAGRPTLSGRAEHDRLARDAWQAIRTALSRHPVAVAARGFDPAAYREALRLSQTADRPGPEEIGPGVILIPGFRGSTGSRPPAAGQGSTAAVAPGPGAQSPWLPVWLGPVVLLLLAGIGWPWARWAIPAHDGVLTIGLAPAFGLGALALASIGVDAAGLHLAGAGGLAAAAVALGVGGGLCLAGRRRQAPGPGS